MRARIVSLIDKFSLTYPIIIQAPMAGGITTPKLVAAVSNAQALGSFATGYLKTEQIETGISEIKKLTKNPFIVNVFIPNKPQQDAEKIKTYQQSMNKFRKELGLEEDISSVTLPNDNFHEIIQVLLKQKIKIVSFTFGNLDSGIVQAFKDNGTYVIGTATSLEEAKILANSKVDAIIAQGHEAGGHRGGFFTPFKRSSITTMALVPRLRDLNLPIIAAGGIMDGTSIVAATTLGACAVQMGTAFLCTKESGASQAYKEALINAKKIEYDATTITNVYTGKPARGVHTRFIEYMEAHHSDAVIPEYPIPNILSSEIRKIAAKEKNINLMSIWSGQGVPLITEDLSVDVLIKKLRDEVENSLKETSTLSPLMNRY